MDGKLSVLTLNAWLLRTPVGIDLAADVETRLQHLPSRIAALNPDIIILQEAWLPSFRKYLANAFSEMGYPYSSHEAASVDAAPHALGWFRSIMGNGLQIVSRFEMDAKIEKLKFSVNTRPDENFVSKGAIRAKVNVPKLGWVDVYNSHLGAVSYRAKEKRFDAQECDRRLTQVLELSQFINQTRSSDFVFLGTDLNAHYHDFIDGKYQRNLSAEFSSMTCPPPYGLGLVDSYSYLNGIRPLQGYTDAATNPYRESGFFKSSPCGVIDYVFATANKYLKPAASEVVLKERVVSDHYGVMSSFTL